MAQTPTTSSNTQQSDSRGVWILLATILASSMAFIDGTALNVALDAIQRQLGASAAQLLWIVNGYMLTLAAFLLLGGALGDRFGRNRIFGAGIALFALCSLACGLAPNVGFLIAARFMQGVGGALMVPGSLAIITATFSPAKRGGAIGAWSAFSTLTTVAGPLIGGFLANAGLWRFVFFINLPLAVVALAALLRVPETRDANASGQLDYAGTVLVALGLAGLTFGAIELGAGGGTDVAPAVSFAALGAGLLALVAFVFVEARSRNPLVRLSLFRSRTFSGTNLMTFFLYGALSAVTFFLPLNLIQVQGYSATLAGVAFLPFSILLITLSPLMGRLTDRMGPRLPLTVGPAIVALAFALLALPGITGGPRDFWISFFPGVIALGLGMGVTVAPLTTAVMSAVPASDVGVASAVNNDVTRSAQVLALASLGGVALVTFSLALRGELASLPLAEGARQAVLAGSGQLGHTPIPSGLDPALHAAVSHAIALAFVDMFRVVALIGAGLALLSALLSWLFVQARPMALQDSQGAPASPGGSVATTDHRCVKAASAPCVGL